MDSAVPGKGYCPFLQNKMAGLLVPFESLDTHSNKKLASLSFRTRRATNKKLSQIYARASLRSSNRPLSGAEEQTARPIIAYAQRACLVSL